MSQPFGILCLLFVLFFHPQPRPRGCDGNSISIPIITRGPHSPQFTHWYTTPQDTGAVMSDSPGRFIQYFAISLLFQIIEELDDLAPCTVPVDPERPVGKALSDSSLISIENCLVIDMLFRHITER